MKVRILADQIIDGLQYKANQVADLPSDMAKALAKEGLCDDNKGAVTYCTDELGEKVINHVEASKSQAQIDYERAVAAAAAARAAADAESDAAKKSTLQEAVVNADAAVELAKAALPQ